MKSTVHWIQNWVLDSTIEMNIKKFASLLKSKQFKVFRLRLIGCTVTISPRQGMNVPSSILGSGTIF